MHRQHHITTEFVSHQSYLVDTIVTGSHKKRQINIIKCPRHPNVIKSVFMPAAVGRCQEVDGGTLGG